MATNFKYEVAKYKYLQISRAAATLEPPSCLRGGNGNDDNSDNCDNVPVSFFRENLDALQ